MEGRSDTLNPWAGGEMVDAHGLGPCEVTHGGSSPLRPTNFKIYGKYTT